jgi:hypothetical protein
MHPSECRRYAEQCLQLAQNLAPEHRDFLLEMADKWRKIADDLDRQNIQIRNIQMDGY